MEINIKNLFKEMSERYLWSLIVKTETLSEICARKGDGRLGVIYMQIGIRARQELYNRFNINLDTLEDITNEHIELLVENWKI